MSPEPTPPNMNDIWTYRARFVRAVDGDTIEILVDLGLRVSSTIRVRVADINAPELRGAEKELGKAARDWVRDFLSADGQGEGESEGWLVIRTRKDKRSFNRYVADVWRADGENLQAATVEAGHAVWV